MKFIKIPKRNPANYMVAAVLVLVPFYAFLTVWGSTLVGHYTLLRLWPELIMLAVLVYLGLTGTLQGVWQELRDKRLAWLFAGLGGLIVLYFVYALLSGVGVRAAGYGLIIDIRPVLWFATVYAVVRRSSWVKARWQWLVLAPLSVVVGFTLLQFFVLPPDFLAHFGYVKDSTITPIQTINQDTTTIRAQSFLRGPNPLGAYVVLGAGLLYISTMRRLYKFAGLALVILALFLTFSRSAWLGLMVTALVWFAARTGFIKNYRKVLAVLLVTLVVLIVSVVQLQSNQGLKNAVLHVNDASTAPQTSNEDRLSALQSGARDVIREPLGRGVGTAGPASVYNQAGASRNSENYFLSLGQELGWLGLALFVMICYRLARLLYDDRSVFALMLFATFAGLTCINLLSYAWADPTLVYLWWGLAATALGTKAISDKKKHG